MASHSQAITNSAMKSRKSEQDLLQRPAPASDFQRVCSISPADLQEGKAVIQPLRKEQEAQFISVGSQDLTALRTPEDDSVLRVQYFGENYTEEAKCFYQATGQDDMTIEPELLSRPTLRLSFDSIPKEPDILADEDPEQEEDFSQSQTVSGQRGLELSPRRPSLLAEKNVLLVRTKSAALTLKPKAESTLVSKRTEELPRTESDLILPQFLPLQVLNYSQGLSALHKTNLHMYMEPPEKESYFARLATYLSRTRLQNEVAIAEYSLVFALEKRRLNLKALLDLDLLYSIWKVLVPHTEFTLSSQSWELLGLPASEALQICNTWGLLQLLYCFSECRALALDLYRLSKTPTRTFSFTARSLSLSAMCLRVAKTGCLNRYFDKIHSVLDVMNELYLGCLVRWTQLHLRHAADKDLEKDVRAKPAKYIQLGKQQIRL